MKRNRTFALAAAALTLSVLGGSGFAAANASDSPSSSEVQTPENGENGAAESEGPGDQAAQDAACVAANIDPNASNINYDAGVCSLDGGNDGGSDN